MQVSDGLHTHEDDVWISKGGENTVHGMFSATAITASPVRTREYTKLQLPSNQTRSLRHRCI
jgi:hypothetical protein